MADGRVVRALITDESVNGGRPGAADGDVGVACGLVTVGGVAGPCVRREMVEGVVRAHHQRRLLRLGAERRVQGRGRRKPRHRAIVVEPPEHGLFQRGAGRAGRAVGDVPGPAHRHAGGRGVDGVEQVPRLLAVGGDDGVVARQIHRPRLRLRQPGDELRRGRGGRGSKQQVRRRHRGKIRGQERDRQEAQQDEKPFHRRRILPGAGTGTKTAIWPLNPGAAR